MTRLTKFTLSQNRKTERWDLRKDLTHRLVKSFPTKEKATSGGVLKKAVGQDGGSIRIEKVKGGYQEERTFPRSEDPRKSKG